MKTEIIKIIEGGLAGDKEKIMNYANVLAENFSKNGDERFSTRILNVINGRRNSLVDFEKFSTRPVDQESRIEIADIWYPNNDVSLILNSYIKEEIADLIKQFSMRDKLISNGLDYSSSILLYGLPGNGKTSLAKYISYQLQKPLVMARFDSLVSSLLGSTSKNIRKLFDYVEKRDCILFLDEFDVVAKARDDENELGELKRVVNSLLQNIDSLKGKNIIIAATNHQKILDMAIWRRFDKVIELKKPNQKEIESYIKIILKDRETDFNDKASKQEKLSQVLYKFSFSEIKTILENSIKKTIINDKEKIEYSDIIYEIYLYQNHDIDDESKFVIFLNDLGITQDEIHKKFKIPLRSIRKFLNISEDIDG